jgi:two-component system sensor histidine kinase KdpD
VDKSFDWVVLLGFLTTAILTTQLLTRAQAAAARAHQRAEEVAWLARLGSETLSAGRAEDALHAITTAISQTLKVGLCEIYRWPEPGGSSPAARAGRSAAVLTSADAEWVRWVGEHGVAAEMRGDGSIIRARGSDAVTLDLRGARSLLLPLQVHDRTVGVLRLAAEDDSIALDEAQIRFLSALAYYAALSVERVRLAAEAERAAALREADRLKDIVLASVSHDLRTPLTTIKALAERAATLGDENAAAIQEQVDRMSRFVGDLLDLSRIKGGAFHVTPELNTAEDLLGAALRQVSGLLNGRTIRKSVDYSQPALLGRFDFVHSLRILTNLLENALRYSPGDAPIDVTIGREGEMLVFTVADHGPGIEPAERDRIFEAFYRPAVSLPDAGRAGLGLAIARQLAELQGGSLCYAPRPEGGSAFALRLPAAELDPAAADEEILAKN